MEESWTQQWQATLQQLRHSPNVLIPFLRHPIDRITTLPNWNWITLAIIQGLFAAISGVLSGILSRSFVNILVGLFIFPITATVGAMVLAGFFYYTFLLLKENVVPLRKLVTIIVLSSIYYMIFRTVTAFLPPADLFGAELTALVLVVGLSDNFGLDRKFVIRVVGALYLVLFIFWGARIIRDQQIFSKPRTPVTTESWEILEREVSSANGQQ